MYSVSRMLNVRVYTFQDPSFFCRFTITCSDELRARVRTGNAGVNPLFFSLFVIIRIASFLRNSKVGIEISFFARAQACTAFTSATDKRKVNCRLGHHFVAQTHSKPIGS